MGPCASSVAMASHLAVASLIVCLAQTGLSRPEQAAASPNFQELIKEIQTSIDKTLADARKSLNLPEDPNGEAIIKAIKEQTHKAEATFNDMKTKVEQQLKSNPQLQETIKNLQARIDEATATLKKDNPEVAANAQTVIDHVKAAYDSITKELTTITAEVNKKGGLKDDLEALLKNLIDKGSAAAKDLQTKVQEAINQATKKS